MLNYNLNIIGSIGPIVDRQGANYRVRLDPYSSSIVLAMPGNLFKDGDYTNQFGMINSYDDISAYVKGGPNGSPVGTNIEILLSASLNPASSSIGTNTNIVKFKSDGYNESVSMNGANALVANKIWPAYEGANLSFSSSFCIEGWFNFPDIATATTSSFTPNRIIAWKYDPIIVSSSQYSFATYGGDIDAGAGINLISGSISFVYDYYTQPTTYLEQRVVTTSSLAFQPNQWYHYAISYTSGSWNPGFEPDRTMKLYVNGVKVRQEQALGTDINSDPNELLQIMGAVDAYYTEGAYSGSQVYWNDIRFYNGTDKNYTGSIIPLPESIVVYGG